LHFLAPVFTEFTIWCKPEKIIDFPATPDLSCVRRSITLTQQGKSSLLILIPVFPNWPRTSFQQICFRSGEYMKNSTLPLLASICILFATTARAQNAPEQARNFQINTTHTGSISSDHLTPPLKQRWVVNFGQPISYPLIADGKVFVTVKVPTGQGTTLYALNSTNGAIVWSSALGGDS
jgi:hypothetical protein